MGEGEAFRLQQHAGADGERLPLLLAFLKGAVAVISHNGVMTMHEVAANLMITASAGSRGDESEVALQFGQDLEGRRCCLGLARGGFL